MEYIILSDHIEREKEMQIVVTDSDSINFQRSDSKYSSKLSFSSR
ncbi:hypothetical protein wTpre_793 [Wolbachia endosymbiont of Trichogramma pretiosum]|nr:hypothetical protein wTpre_793 [Wolbachia endosymbiont of Trichogramma pretiosum]